MVAYEGTSELEAVCTSFHIQLADPVKVLDFQFGRNESFERFLSLLVRSTYFKRTSEGRQNLFRGPVAEPVVTSYDTNYS
jgi:hypothetical protein